MRKTMSLLLLGLVATAPLAAQSWNPDGPRGDRGERADRPDRDGGGRDDRQRDDGDARASRDERAAGFEERGRDWRRGERGDDRGVGRGWQERGDWQRHGNRDGSRDPRGDRPGPGYDGRGRNWQAGPGGGYAGPGGRPGPDRGWNGRDGRWDWRWRDDRRYDWQGYRSSNRMIYRAPRYYGPRGDDYSRWSRGTRVQPYFYGRNYWINDPYRYRLPPAYGDYRWVRYYDDVALVDVRSGLIQDIIYSFFWR